MPLKTSFLVLLSAQSQPAQSPWGPLLSVGILGLFVLGFLVFNAITGRSSARKKRSGQQPPASPQPKPPHNEEDTP